MLYILMMLVFLMLLGICIIVKKQNSYFQQHGLKVIGRVITIEDRPVQTKKLSGAAKIRPVPIIEYAHKSNTWHFQSDENNEVSQRKVGDIVDLVVHPAHPLVMTEQELKERSILSLIFMGLLIVPLGMCFAIYQFNEQASQFMLFEPLGITAQHLDDLVAVIVMLKLATKVFWPMWKRWKKERDTSFLGLPFNAKVVSKHREASNEQRAETTMV